MRIIKAGLKSLTPSQVVGKSEFVEQQMTGNTAFPTPTPSLTDVTAARVALVAAIKEAESGAHAAIASKNVAARNLANALVQLSRYVNSAADGDVDKAVSSGFDLAKQPDPIDKLDAPINFQGVTGPIAGQVALRWKGVRGGRLYAVYMLIEEGAVGIWKLVGTTSKARFTVKELVTMKEYEFRTAALGVVGEGPVSQVITARAA